jgi:hypothetical protein
MNPILRLETPHVGETLEPFRLIAMKESVYVQI